MDVSEMKIFNTCLKEIPHEQQTPLEQNLIFFCCKICPWKQNFSFREQAVFQLSCFTNRQLKQRSS